MKTPIIAAAAAAIALTALAGCTNVDKATGSKTPTPSSSATSKATKANDPHRHDDKCVDGIAYIDVDTAKEKTLKGDCETVWVTGDKGTVHLDAVKDLGILGTGNTIDVKGITRLDAEGNDNTITHGGKAPQSVGDGENTTIQAAD